MDPVSETVARAYLRFSPRNLKLSDASVKRLSEGLLATGFRRFFIYDSRKGMLRKSLARIGWTAVPAIPSSLDRKCSVVAPMDLPIDERLIDSDGAAPNMSNTQHMVGIRVAVGEGGGWAFYTDEGDTVRVISEKERRQGMLVARSTDDLLAVADCLVRYLAACRKSWAVFSVDLGRFIRQFSPITMHRMVLERPKAFDHRGRPLSRLNRKAAIGLFSEYYDESRLMSIMRLRRFEAEGNYRTFLVDGGFVIVRFEGNTGLIYDIYVTPSKQGKGLGAELMRCAITQFAGRASSVYLHTSYPRAFRLYEKFGFRSVYRQLGIKLDEWVFSPPAVR
jgi:GNAT superfamily N-acetyltransferase